MARIGIVTPVLTRVVGAHGRWERTAGLADVTAVAETADRLGYDHLTCAEHVAVPTAFAETRGATYWDPLATLGYLAARTTRIRLATSVVVLGYHHPLALAKRYGTLDRVSGGRLVLGVGVGSLAEEFELLGAPFEDRGVRADDALRALRAALSQTEPVYEGPVYRFGGMIVDPCAAQAHVPIWVGGRTGRSLRRAVTLADGWMPFGLSADELERMLAGTERAAGFDAVLAPDRALDPSGQPAATQDIIGRLTEIGATIISVRLFAQSLADYLEQLEALAVMT